jgi:hypothetical protein
MKVFCLTIALILSGCANLGRVDQMAVSGKPGQRVAESPLRGNIYIQEITTISEENSARTNVGASVFEQALEQSLRSVGLLASNAKDARYGLTGKIQKIDQPYFGGNMTVTIWTEYVMQDRSAGEEIFRTTIGVPYTARLLDALYGVERLRLATEGAARQNISKLIDDLFALRTGIVPIARAAAPSKIPNSSEEKLRELQRLNEAGLISKEVYLDQQKMILSTP